MINLNNKIAVITGATSGIGKAIALVLAAEGVHVHLVGRDKERLESVRQDLVSSTIHPLDLTNDDAVHSFANTIPNLDILIHSAGIIQLSNVSDSNMTDFDLQYRINLRAPFLLTQLLLPKLKASQGQIVFINSGAGLRANPAWSQYAATKHGLKAIADSLRTEVQSDGVRVISIYPGRTASPMQAAVRKMEGQDYEPETYIQPEDVAAQVLSVLKLEARASVTDLSIRPI